MSEKEQKITQEELNEALSSSEEELNELASMALSEEPVAIDPNDILRMDGSINITGKMPADLEEMHIAFVMKDGTMSYRVFQFTEDAGLHFLQIIPERMMEETFPDETELK